MAFPDQIQRQRSLEIKMIRMLMALRSTSPKVLKSGAVSRSQMSRVEKAVGEDAFLDADYPDVELAEWSEFLLSLTRELDLVSPKDGKIQLNLEVIDQFFAKPDEERLRALREAWLKSEFFNEFFAIKGIEVVNIRATTRQTGGADCVPGVTELRRMRAALVARLEDLSEGKWQGLEAWLKKIEAEDPEIMLSPQTHPLAHTPTYVGIRERDAKHELEREGNWQVVEGAMLLEMMRFPMMALGLIDYDTSTKKPRFRLTSSDSTALRLSEKPLMIQPNYDVMALIPEMSVAAIWRLARVSSITSFGQAAHFKLEEPWVVQAINTGQSVDEIVKELSDASKTPLPQNVEYSIQEWGRRSERITIWLDAAFVEAEGIRDAAEALREKGGEDFEQIGERHAVMPMSALAKNRQALPPRASEIDYSRSLPPVLRAAPDGVLTLEHEGAHYRARQAVTRYAEEVGLDRYQVSKQSLEAAKRSGKNAEAVVDELGELCSNDLPALFEAKVWAWMRGDIEAVVGAPTVVHLSDERVAMLLANAPEVGDIFGSPLSLRNFCTGLEGEQLLNALEELGINAKHSDEDLEEELSHRGPTSFAHSHRAPAARRDGFDSFRFKRYLETGFTPALLYALEYRESIMASTTSSHLPEMTLVTPLALWTDGQEAFVELDCQYLHRIEILRVSWLKQIGPQR